MDEEEERELLNHSHEEEIDDWCEVAKIEFLCTKYINER
jgi:hypothetical protein